MSMDNYQNYLNDKKEASKGDGNKIVVESTSYSTASVSPIILSDSDKKLTRTIFEPKFVDNIHGSDKCIEGKLIYERRSKRDEYPTEKTTPRSIKPGESVALPLDTTAVFKLYQSLTDLYRVYEQDGIPHGYASYKRIDNSFNELLEIIQNDPSAAEMIGQPENFELVKKLLQLITTTDSTESLSKALQSLQNDRIAQLDETINIERLNRVIELIESSLENGKEEFWQTEVFKDNQWVLAQLFASPCTISEGKAYVGGKAVDNSGANLCDFLYHNQLTKNVVLIEIKTPKTKIIQGDYRNTFYFTKDMSGAINQVINYRDSLVKNYFTLVGESEKQFFAYAPKCVVIIGMLSDMGQGEIAAFENYRNSLNNIDIFTYDEILLRLKNLRLIFTQPMYKDEEVDYDNLPF